MKKLTELKNLPSGSLFYASKTIFNTEANYSVLLRVVDPSQYFIWGTVRKNDTYFCVKYTIDLKTLKPVIFTATKEKDDDEEIEDIFSKEERKAIEDKDSPYVTLEEATNWGNPCYNQIFNSVKFSADFLKKNFSEEEVKDFYKEYSQNLNNIKRAITDLKEIFFSKES